VTDRAVEEVAKKLDTTVDSILFSIAKSSDEEYEAHRDEMRAVALCVSQSEELLRIRKAADGNLWDCYDAIPNDCMGYLEVCSPEFVKAMNGLRAALERP
jgi:hypothetical protein